MCWFRLEEGDPGVVEFIPCEHDDIGFLSLVQRIVNGAIITLNAREIYLVHVDNWFDWKWLGWRSRKGQELNIPPFDPNRVHSEKHFIWDTEALAVDVRRSANAAPPSPARPLRVRSTPRPVFEICGLRLV